MELKNNNKPATMFYLVLSFLLSWLTFLLVEVFRDQLYVVFDAETYLILHLMAEMFSIIVSVSIFGFGWFTYRQSKNNYILFLAIAFLGIGLFDFIHALSFPGMPMLITESTTDKGIQFWLAARLFGAVAFLASAFIATSETSKTLPKKTLLVFVLFLVAADFTWVNFFPESLLVFFEPGVGLTPIKVALEYLVIAISAAALLAYYWRYRKTKEQILAWFMCAIVISIFSELAFTQYKSAYDTYNLLGHIFKVAAFILIYRGVFITSTSESYVRLQQSEEEFSTAFLNSPNLMVISVPETGEVVEVNDSFCDFIGYTRKELVGATSSKLKVWADPRQRDRIIEKLNSGVRSHAAEVQLRTKLGDVRTVIDSTDYIYIGSRRYMLSVGVDITERRHMESELEESQRKLKRTVQELKKDERHIRELSELRAKFIQIISHQLRTPLGSIRWILNSFLDGSVGQIKPSQKQLLKLMYKADVAVINRLNDMLVTIDIEESRVVYNKSRMSMEALVKSVLLEVRHDIAEKKLKLVFKNPKLPLPRVYADPQKIRVVIEKLIENAVVFTPKKGRIEVQLAQHGDNVRLSVSDTGIGIPKREHPYVFDSFFRASNAYLVEPSATGVGLSIAKSFVEQQGGTIGFDSKEGEGSTFWFEMSTLSEDAVTKNQSAELPGDKSARG